MPKATHSGRVRTQAAPRTAGALCPSATALTAAPSASGSWDPASNHNKPHREGSSRASSLSLGSETAKEKVSLALLTRHARWHCWLPFRSRAQAGTA